MKRFINFLKVEKWFTVTLFTSIVVAIVATFAIACCLEATTLSEITKSIFFGTVAGVVAFAMLTSLYHPEN